MSNNVQQVQQRGIAYKAWIGDLLKGNFSFDGERFNFVEIAQKKISRVNIVANVIDKYESENPEKQYAALTLDDASGQIRAKTFGGDTKKFLDINIGNTILVIGQLRYFNNELYVIPEITRQLDEKWLIVRKLELDEEYGALSKENIPLEEKPLSPSIRKEEKAEKIFVTEEKIADEQKQEETNENVKESVFNIIKKNDNGVDVDTLIMSVNYPIYDINAAISALVEEGRIYEPRPGKLRVI